MELSLSKFHKACNPYITLIPSDSEDWEYYIDFSSIRGRDIARELSRAIALSQDYPTCQLLAGHNGCGKSIELLRLKRDLESQGFYVVYFESSHYLNMTDVITIDILLAVACEVIKNLETWQFNLYPTSLIKQFTDFYKLLKLDNFNDFINFDDLYTKIVEIIKNNTEHRLKFKHKLEPETNTIRDLINQEIFDVLHQHLKSKNEKKIVVIVDNLERLNTKYIKGWRSVFIERAESLRQLNCHMIYTIPLALIFSKDSETISRFLGGGTLPGFLSMIPVRSRNGEECKEGIELLQQIVLARAFPTIQLDRRLDLIQTIFDDSETLERLCLISGGHIQTLLKLLYNCLRKQDPPFSRTCLEDVIREYREQLRRTISEKEWKWLIEVAQDQNEQEIIYQKWLQFTPSNFLFEYSNKEETWFALNPILAEDKKLQSKDFYINPKKDNNMKDFFISYNTADIAWAEWIAWILEEAGYSVVIAAWDFRPGGNFPLEMQKAAAGTQRTIAILSDNYINAEYTHPEWAAAFARDPQGKDRTLIPIRVDQCDLIGMLKTIIFVDIIELTEQDARSAILGAFSGRAKPTQAPQFPGTTRSERVTQTQVQYPGNSTEENFIDSVIVTNSSKKNWTQQERIALMKQISALSARQFNMLIFALNPPPGEIPEMPSSQHERTFALLTWAERPGSGGLDVVEQLLQTITNS